MRRTPAVAFLLVTIFVDMLGLGLVVPIFPALMTAITGRAATAAQWSGVIQSSYGLAQFLIAPLLGRVSDRYGRRPVLVAGLTVLGLDYLAHGVANRVGLLIAAHTLAGALAGTATVVNSYLADITPPADRPRRYGQLGAAFSLGFVGGPVLGGLLGGISLRLPFYVAAALALGNALYGLVIVPESRRGDRRTNLTWRVANPVSSLTSLLRDPALRGLTIGRLLSDIARIANQCLWVYVMLARFTWSTTRVGLVLAASSVVGAVVSARLAGPFVTRLGHRRATVVCAVAGAASLGGYGAAPAATIPAWLCLGAVAAIGASATQSWLADLAGDDRQGTLQGAFTGVASLAETVVPLGSTVVFAWSLGLAMPGLGLIVAAACALASAAVFSRATVRLSSVDSIT